LDVIRYIDYQCVEDFIWICSLCSSPELPLLMTFIESMRSIFISKWKMMDHEDFGFLLRNLKVQLQERNALWVGNVNDILDLVNQVVSL